MPRIIITAEANAAIRGAARGHSFDGLTAIKQPDGSFSIELEEDTIERLNEHVMAGETVSDTIVRMCALEGRKPS